MTSLSTLASAHLIMSVWQVALYPLGASRGVGGSLRFCLDFYASTNIPCVFLSLPPQRLFDCLIVFVRPTVRLPRYDV